MQRRRFLNLLSGVWACTCLPAIPSLAAESVRNPKGMVTLTFDDGLAGVYKYAWPILRSRNQPATAAAIVSRLFVDNDDYMTREQLAEMEKGGWEIASHSLTHTRPIHIPKYYSQELITGWSVDSRYPKTYQTQYEYDLIAGIYQDGNPLTEVEKEVLMNDQPGTYYFDRCIAELHVHPVRGGDPDDLDIRAGSYQRELEQSQRVLTEMGFKVTTYIAPYNYWPDDMKETSKYYYRQAVTGKDNDNRPATFDPYAIKRFMGHDKDPVSNFQRIIRENTEGFGGWVIFCFHSVGDGLGWEPYSAEKLDELSAWLARENIPVVTIDQGAQIMREAAKATSNGDNRKKKK
jgi:hypothetical protein